MSKGRYDKTFAGEDGNQQNFKIDPSTYTCKPSCIAQSVTCLIADKCLTADTFLEIDHEIISTATLLPSADSRRVVVSYKRKYVQESTG